MADPRLEQLARVLVNNSTAIKPRDHVAVIASCDAAGA